MRKKIGIADFDIKAQEVQTCEDKVDNATQTEPNCSHVAIQAHGFNQADFNAQTDLLPQLKSKKSKKSDPAERSPPFIIKDNEPEVQMQQKKLIKKTQSKKKKDGGSDL